MSWFEKLLDNTFKEKQQVKTCCVELHPLVKNAGVLALPLYFDSCFWVITKEVRQFYGQALSARKIHRVKAPA